MLDSSSVSGLGSTQNENAPSLLTTCTSEATSVSMFDEVTLRLFSVTSNLAVERMAMVVFPDPASEPPTFNAFANSLLLISNFINQILILLFQVFVFLNLRHRLLEYRLYHVIVALYEAVGNGIVDVSESVIIV